jgi:hypothetical protein
MDPPVLLKAAYDAFNEAQAPVTGAAQSSICGGTRGFLVSRLITEPPDGSDCQNIPAGFAQRQPPAAPLSP